MKIDAPFAELNESQPRKTRAGVSTILVPTDFTEASEDALVFATSMAADLGARIVLCHVYQLPTPLAGAELSAVPPAQLGAEIDRAARYGVEQAIARHAKEAVSMSAVVRPGDPEFEIRTIAQEVRADLIVLGSHGRTGLMRILIGSVSDDVIHHSEIPVLVLHGRAPKKS